MEEDEEIAVIKCHEQDFEMVAEYFEELIQGVLEEFALDPDLDVMLEVCPEASRGTVEFLIGDNEVASIYLKDAEEIDFPEPTGKYLH